ncbi:hypothetical protein VaNZ11_013065 [Volvox africanus]|uniref:Peptidase A1 domain-containing protein n=1 Tax=Volvox africanus TaxID=51714 RepID=A0ABQ5SF96_9CHLO|nr:hypothetical protein VaNZ11_013065 [Volvox africanus]
MQRTPLSGGSLIRGAVSRRAVLASLPWTSLPHYRASKLCTNALARGDRTGNLQSLALEHVLEQLRKVQGIYRLAPNVEATVTGRGKHLGIAVSWNLRWTASGCFSEEIRGPQLTFKWGYDGREDSGCWEVDSSGLVRIMECDDHEAVLMTTYIRTGCWLQPHLKDRFDMELLPKPLISVTATSGSSSSSSGRRSAVPNGGAVAERGDTRSNAPAENSNSSSSHKQQSTIPATAATVTATATAAPVRSANDRGGGGAGGHEPATAATHGSSQSGATPALDDVIAIGLRLKGRKLRVRVLVRRRDWRLLGFDHRMCADVETWELGEWKEWAEGVQYPSSALHKASNGGQHAYLTVGGAAEHVAPPPQLPEVLLPPAIAGAAAAVTASSSSLSPSSPPLGSTAINDSSADTASSPTSRSSPNVFAVTGLTAALQLPRPTDFGMPLLPPIPGDTRYYLQGGKEAVPLWRSASGHFLVRPTINGQPGGGYFVLDTGASGFVVTPQAAARLGGQSFGETHAASISGKVAARFVRMSSWSLGGLCIQQPVLMVMALDGLVRGTPGEVVGIVGHDLFRRAVVEVPQLLEVKGGGAFATAGGVVSGSDSGSDCEEDHDTLGVSREREVSTAAGASSVSALYAGGNGSSSEAPFGPPLSALRSIPVFDDVGAAAAALSQPPSVAAAAVPSPTVVQEPSSSPLCFTVPRETHGKPGSHLTPGSSVTAAAEESSRGDTCIHNSRSRFTAGPGASCSSNDSTSSSSSSRNGSGQSLVARASAGRSTTARAVWRAALTVPYTVHEMMLHHPLEYGNESEWVWEPLVMIANLPHVHLCFADPGGGPPRSVLVMVDSGACGADLMLHSRSQKELGLLPAATAGGPSGTAGGGGGGGSSSAGKSQGHYLRGVGQEPRDFVQLQMLDVPWLEVAGVRFEQIRCMCAAIGGLDISIYSHGILCGDLLARLEWAIDYTHKRIGFRRGAFAPAPSSTPLLL